MRTSPRLFSVVALALAVAAGAALAARPGSAAEAKIDWNEARQHWAFRPVQKPPVPAVHNAAWVRTRIDAFIRAALEKKGLSPSPEADPRTLIRRVTLDLTGLPPAPEEVEAFMRDCSNSDSISISKVFRGRDRVRVRVEPRAYERLVDRLLASPRFGERMASMWLPLARYAEDQAHQVGADTKFFYPNAYLYRQWVIDAFNRDLPYQDFVKMQIAADKYAEPTPENLAALGFIGLGPKYYNRDRLEVQADEWEDRVDTVTRTFLGLTVACARCHDHKFDPITREDYYGLAGIFASSKMVNRKPDGAEDKPEKNKPMSDDTVHMVQDENPHDLTVFIRGNVNRPGPKAPRGFIKILSKEEKPIGDGSGRKELADAIADWKNPLTARVIVNR